MARLPRLALAGHAHHLLQRGNNGQAIFIDRLDRERALSLVTEQASRHAVAVHAYVLLDSQLQLLVTPDSATGLQQFMQAVGRSYVRYFNDRHGRSGTLWDGRYRSALIQAEHYLLACMAHMDLSPVRAGLVGEARDFLWSSHAHYVGLRQERGLSPHLQYWALGNTPFDREAAYAKLVHDGLRQAEQAALNEATLHGWAVGDAAFLQQLQRATARRVVKAKAGRPPASRPR